MSITSGSYANPPSFLVIGVGDNNTLFGYDLLQSQSTTAAVASAVFPIADSVFEMHALYGIDTNYDNKVDTWVAPTGDYAPAALTAADGSGIPSLCKIKAIRLGLITQTALMEKTNVNSGSISLFSDLASVSLNITRTITGDNLKFRYRTIETTIPLRNMLNATCQP
jgi:type IV pilus assembly protein PilW